MPKFIFYAVKTEISKGEITIEAETLEKANDMFCFSDIDWWSDDCEEEVIDINEEVE